MRKANLIGPFADACSYPGLLDEQAVERSLADYLAALRVERKIVRLRDGWNLAEHESLNRQANAILDDFAQRTGRTAPVRAARAARAALDALDARAALAALDALAARDGSRALHRFTAWCIQSRSWGWWWRFDLSYLSTTYIGARQLGKPSVENWSRPIYEAFLAGAWLIHFTDDTLYWVAKPTVHTESAENAWNGRRLHSETTAALESAVERLYFWHGILVPAFVVVRPDWITLKHIADEENAEVRRILIERFGAERYVVELGATREQADDYGELYRVARPDDSDLVMVRVINSTPEPDGTSKVYWLRVPPTIESAREAVAWTFGIERAHDYAPVAET